MRAIDGDELLGIERLLDTDVIRKSKTASWLLDQVLHDIQAMPTLTLPNETPPCYQPDGDGCAYQCYDGDDEPIDKCKECPLCYSDKQRHHAPPNEPLTLDELREMDGEPVWVEEVEHWALIDIEKSGQWAGIPFAVWAENGANFTYNIEGRELHCFRRPPEGEEE